MAKIQEEMITIKFSKLVKESGELGEKLMCPQELIDQLELVAQELAGADIVVEIM